MTNEQLSMAQEIKDELLMLKSALSQLNKSVIFSVDDGSCYSRVAASSFLAELHTELKMGGVRHINGKILDLEREFKEL